jgi:hypothetical protein
MPTRLRCSQLSPSNYSHLLLPTPFPAPRQAVRPWVLHRGMPSLHQAKALGRHHAAPINRIQVFSHLIFLLMVWNQGALRVFCFPHLLPPVPVRPPITVLPVHITSMAWLGDGPTSQCRGKWAKQHASPDTTSSHCIYIILTYHIPLFKIHKLGVVLLGGVKAVAKVRTLQRRTSRQPLALPGNRNRLDQLRCRVTTGPAKQFRGRGSRTSEIGPCCMRTSSRFREFETTSVFGENLYLTPRRGTS